MKLTNQIITHYSSDPVFARAFRSDVDIRRALEISLRCDNQEPYPEIAKDYGVTRVRIGQIYQFYKLNMRPLLEVLEHQKERGRG